MLAYYIAVIFFTGLMIVVKMFTTKFAKVQNTIQGDGKGNPDNTNSTEKSGEFHKYEKFNIGIELCVGAVIAGFLKIAHYVALNYEGKPATFAEANEALHNQTKNMISNLDKIPQFPKDPISDLVIQQKDSLHHHLGCIDKISNNLAELATGQFQQFYHYVAFACISIVLLFIMVYIEQERHIKMGANAQSKASDRVIATNFILGMIIHVVFVAIIETH